jgi:hypothetical protein
MMDPSYREGTPAEVYNRPGLSGISYRTGTHAAFKRSMLARLSDARLPALRGLNTREDDDFSIALIDAWATVADVLSFYSERIANESYLRTATERISLLHLARLIGYELAPGAAADAHLAFELETAPGAPKAVTIGRRTGVQSLPGQDERPQTFETTQEIVARPEWNRLLPRRTEARKPGMDETEVYLAGVTTGLRLGDGLLLLGTEREDAPTSNNWDFRRLKTITPDPEAGRTRVTWQEGLGWRRGENTVAPAEDPKVYALRQRASLFGHNAPDWIAMPQTIQESYKKRYQENHPNEPVPTDDTEWPGFGFTSGDTIHLDAVYPLIAVGSWVVLSVSDYEEVYEVLEVEEESRTDFTLTAKTTRLKLSGENLRARFGTRLRDTTVYAQSERLELAEYPVDDPVEGDELSLAAPPGDLEPLRTLVVEGKRSRVRVATTGLSLKSADGSREVPLEPGDSLRALGPSEDLAGELHRWHLVDRDGFAGFVTAREGNFLPQPALEDDETVCEVAWVRSLRPEGAAVVLEGALTVSYDRASVIVHANVASATHGESREEVLGGGDASISFQSFVLREAPVTYKTGPPPTGTETTLEVRVNGVRWREVPDLYGCGPGEHVYVTRRDEEGRTAVRFGDGRTAARLPTGTENVRAAYRKGLGSEGLVQAGQLSLLMTPVLGVRGVRNPLAALGAEDPEAFSEARRNAPLTVLTLDRVVSLRDYEDFARAYRGMAKAHATWIRTGEARQVFLTVAGSGGRNVGAGLLEDLVRALRAVGDPNLPLAVESYRPAFFGLRARMRVDPDYVPERVVQAVREALGARFGFETRSFGQGAALGEVVAAIQGVPGVVMVDVEELYRLPKDLEEEEQPQPFLEARAPVPGQEGAVDPAELLTLDPAKLELEVMP